MNVANVGELAEEVVRLRAENEELKAQVSRWKNLARKEERRAKRHHKRLKALGEV